MILSEILNLCFVRLKLHIQHFPLEFQFFSLLINHFFHYFLLLMIKCIWMPTSHSVMIPPQDLTSTLFVLSFSCLFVNFIFLLKTNILISPFSTLLHISQIMCVYLLALHSLRVISYVVWPYPRHILCIQSSYPLRKHIHPNYTLWNTMLIRYT